MVVLIPVDASSCLYRFPMPSVYPVGGYVVDVSNVYTTIKTAIVCRRYVTATGVPDANEYRVASVNPNDFAHGKFAIMAYRLTGGLLNEVAAGTDLSSVSIEVLVFGDRP